MYKIPGVCERRSGTVQQAQPPCQCLRGAKIQVYLSVLVPAHVRYGRLFVSAVRVETQVFIQYLSIHQIGAESVKRGLLLIMYDSVGVVSWHENSRRVPFLLMIEQDRMSGCSVQVASPTAKNVSPPQWQP